MTYDEAFEQVVSDGTIQRPPKDAVFEFVDAVLDRQPERVFELCAECKKSKEPVLIMLSVLYNNIRAVLQVQTCGSSNVERATGLTAWQVRNARKHLHKYTDLELENALALLSKCSRGLKIGILDEAVAVEYVLVHVL